MFVAVYLKKQFPRLLALVVLSLLSLAFRGEFGWIPFAMFSTTSFVLILLWFKSYQAVQRNAKSYLRTIDDPLTSLVLGEEQMEISNSNGSKRISWNSVDEFVMTEDFVIPVSGKVPLICLPKKELSSDAIQWLSQK